MLFKFLFERFYFLLSRVQLWAHFRVILTVLSLIVLGVEPHSPIKTPLIRS